jgi:hypothetical protein
VESHAYKSGKFWLYAERKVSYDFMWYDKGRHDQIYVEERSLQQYCQGRMGKEWNSRQTDHLIDDQYSVTFSNSDLVHFSVLCRHVKAGVFHLHFLSSICIAQSKIQSPADYFMPANVPSYESKSLYSSPTQFFKVFPHVHDIYLSYHNFIAYQISIFLCYTLYYCKWPC